MANCLIQLIPNMIFLDDLSHWFISVNQRNFANNVHFCCSVQSTEWDISFVLHTSHSLPHMCGYSIHCLVDTVETPYITIPYTTIFDITRWTHGPQNLQRPIRSPIVLLDFEENTFRVSIICLFTAYAVNSEWTHMWPATSVNNDGQDRLPQTFTPYGPSHWSQ